MTALDTPLPAPPRGADRRGPLRPTGLTVSRARVTQRDVRRASLAVALTLAVSALLLRMFEAVSWPVLILGLAVSLLALQFAKIALLRRWKAQGRLTPNVVVVGATDQARHFIQAALKGREIAVLGVFDDRARGVTEVEGVPLLGGLEALASHRLVPFIDRIVIAVPDTAKARISDLLGKLSEMPNEINLIVGDSGEQVAAHIAGAPLARLSGTHADARRAVIKRAMDVTLAGLGLLVAGPVMLACAIAIRLEGPGPVFFRQRRHGFNNEEILVWKFRTMHHHREDATASRQVTANDDRITKVGRFLRPTSLDELPQIFNVLKGEMSLVGPRPHAIGMKTGDVESAKLVAGYARRHRMKPGLTGWAAVNGSRGPVDTPESVRRRVELDVAYIERQNLWLDLWIVAITVPCLLGDRSAVR